MTKHTVASNHQSKVVSGLTHYERMEAMRNESHISQEVKFTVAKHNKDIKQLNFLHVRF